MKSIKYFSYTLILLSALSFGFISLTHPNDITNFPELSYQLLKAVKDQKDPAALIQQLAEADENELFAQLKTDQEKKVFWINIYNAFTQIKLSKEPELYEDRGAFFRLDFIQIAGRTLSLDRIEHDFLRKSKIKISLGYLSKPFVASYIKKYRVKKLDYRIHFVLNCGAADCPKVRLLRPATLEQQLEQATREYIHETSVYKEEEKAVYVTPLMSWFRADFGGKRGTRKILKKHQFIPEDTKASIKFNKYDWTLKLGTFQEDAPFSADQDSEK